MNNSVKKSSKNHHTICGDLYSRVLDAITQVRQNHALEHATIAVLLERRDVRVRMAGYAGLNGFYILGDIPTGTLHEAAHEGLRRLKAGEKNIAISRMCGTNLAVAGLCAGMASAIVARRHSGMSRFSRIIAASVAAALVSQSLGPLAQRYITTDSNLGNVRIVEIRKSAFGKFIRYKVILERK